MNVSKRLKTIVSLIPSGSKVADIGSDHGYLLLLLASRGDCSRLFGVENKRGPYERLSSAILSSPYSRKIELSFSDGLEALNDDFDTVVIAGMGYENIAKIVLKDINKTREFPHFIVDSHTSLYELRKLFVSLNYAIEDERIIYERGVFYEIVSFLKSDGKLDYSEDELHFGPILLKNKEKLLLKKYELSIARLEEQEKGKEQKNSEIEEKITNYRRIYEYFKID
jgi:tRNA (adenine22-N1)-methyltransferase